MSKAIAFLMMVIVVIAISVGGWYLTRWVHWKLMYSGKVKAEIGRLETRIERLESLHNIQEATDD